MNRRDELKQQYKEIEIKAGIYQIKNTQNGKVFIGSTRNVKTLNGKRFELKAGASYNKELQQEWNEYGEDAFVIEMLETIKVDEEKYNNLKKDLEKLEEKWLEKLQPFGERGYNK
jgi:GIY-YIG catalytic domain